MGLSAPAAPRVAFSFHRSTSCLRLAAICAGSVVAAVLAASALASSSSRSALARFHLSISDALGGLDTNVLLGAGCARGCRDCDCAPRLSAAAEGSAPRGASPRRPLRAGAGPAAMTCLGGGGGGGASSASSFGGGGGGRAALGPLRGPPPRVSPWSTVSSHPSTSASAPRPPPPSRRPRAWPPPPPPAWIDPP